MKIRGDTSAFWVVVDEIKESLKRLNEDDSFSGVIARFRVILDELPFNISECEVVPTIGTNEHDTTFIIGPGARLNALAVALRTLEDVFIHDVATFGDEDVRSFVKADQT